MPVHTHNGIVAMKVARNLGLASRREFIRERLSLAEKGVSVLTKKDDRPPFHISFRCHEHRWPRFAGKSSGTRVDRSTGRTTSEEVDLIYHGK